MALRPVECKYQPWPEMVERLELLLKEAKDGELRSFGYVVERRNGDCGNFAFQDVGSNAFKFAGLIVALLHRVTTRYLVSDSYSEKLE